jgi:hypothetical protein
LGVLFGPQQLAACSGVLPSTAPSARLRRARERFDLLDAEHLEPPRAVFTPLRRGRGRIAGQLPPRRVLRPQPKVEDRREHLAVLVDAARAHPLARVRHQQRLDLDGGGLGDRNVAERGHDPPDRPPRPRRCGVPGSASIER